MAGSDLPTRQQTLRATLEWSYDLLSETQKELFRTFSVFTGGCTLEAVEEVYYADLPLCRVITNPVGVQNSDFYFGKRRKCERSGCS